MEELYAGLVVFAVIVIIAIVANVSFRRKIDKICQTPEIGTPKDFSTVKEDFSKASTLLEQENEKLRKLEAIARKQRTDTRLKKINDKREQTEIMKNLPDETYTWEKEGDSYFLIYNGEKRHLFEVIYSGKTHTYVKKGELLNVSYCDNCLMYNITNLISPESGAFFPLFQDGDLCRGQKIIKIDTRPEALEEAIIWEKKLNNHKNELIKQREKRRMQLEKETIAQRILEKQRRRELEKQVRQELIDKGILFGDEVKRPPIPQEIVDAVYRRDKGRCVKCGSTQNLQLDHIIPFSKGGATSVENLQLLCQKCNLEKSNKIG